MDNIFVRIILIMLAFVGVYKIFPQIQKPVDYYLYHPQFQNNVVSPAVKMANSILPEKVQIPTPAVMGVSSSATSSSSPIQELTTEISKKAADLASDQIEIIRKSATDQFCSALLEKIEKECGKDTTQN